MSSTRRVHLLIIDPQNDFCDLPSGWCPQDPASGQTCVPTLPVAGAHEDMLRLAAFIAGASEHFTAITTTLDSHHQFDVAHPPFWVRADGGEVQPFTAISAAQVRAGEYLPKDVQARVRVQAYVDALEAQGRYQLMVWPVHCEIGTWGHNVHAAVRQAYVAWELAHGKAVSHVFKGTNPWTEHYSAMQAEVPDAADPSTHFNQPLFEALTQTDVLIIAGEASSHCVKATTEHVVSRLSAQGSPQVVLLTDCMSPVAGFAAEHAAFLQDMKSAGIRLMSSHDMLAQLNNLGAH